MKIAHFIHDEKFPDFAYIQFEAAAPGCSDYFIVGEKRELKYVKKIEPKFIPAKSFSDAAFLKKLAGYDLIVLHSLTMFNKRLVYNLDKNIRILWVGMGYDYYSLINDELVLPKTHSILNKGSFQGNNTFLALKSKLKKVLKIEVSWSYLLERIDYFSPVLYGEYAKLQSLYPLMNCKFIDWNYGSTCNVLNSLKDVRVSGNSVLLGNSAAPPNNHIEALDVLHSLMGNKRTVYLPLSYGASSKVRDKIIHYARNLDLDIEPLTEFMEQTEYFKLISECSHVVMNHCRQQGVGNIVVALYLGSRVFVNEKNDAYSHFRDLGCVIHTMAELQNSPELLSVDLDEKSKLKNREIIEKEISFSHVQGKTKKLIAQCID
ncbi:TDP-N-acetylfucosamine:lipid II N-acetylfucosaminyltransferase [Pseudoalteromonas rubra]|uniref:TDP-N-acetylfucosamine:lipid II N-acetylfucosaminyltransferase n=1 Tax=Pseudoalteromonas rubra TaxID=43658 RepID=UPI002DB6C75A|nr:TDP-N-acetylfucosamine:lipid II N-acetylfucosaminyltransferase [Pseudoalteromonas rubra]MEC4089926.1 TDP-N-acetylfucosamine:lipid II N-acetylfucosaminyltransferase [Pseudoalteromonas rubra]